MPLCPPAVTPAAGPGDARSATALGDIHRASAALDRRTAETFGKSKAGRHERAMCLARAEAKEACANVADSHAYGLAGDARTWKARAEAAEARVKHVENMRDEACRQGTAAVKAMMRVGKERDGARADLAALVADARALAACLHALAERAHEDVPQPYTTNTSRKYVRAEALREAARMVERLAAMRARIDGARVPEHDADCATRQPQLPNSVVCCDCSRMVVAFNGSGEHPLQARVRELEAQVSNWAEACGTADVALHRLRAGVEAEAEKLGDYCACFRDAKRCDADCEAWFDTAARLRALLATSAGAEKTGDHGPCVECNGTGRSPHPICKRCGGYDVNHDCSPFVADAPLSADVQRPPPPDHAHTPKGGT